MIFSLVMVVPFFHCQKEFCFFLTPQSGSSTQCDDVKSLHTEIPPHFLQRLATLFGCTLMLLISGLTRERERCLMTPHGSLREVLVLLPGGHVQTVLEAGGIPHTPMFPCHELYQKTELLKMYGSVRVLLRNLLLSKTSLRKLYRVT